jgi:hypothetical protein
MLPLLSQGPNHITTPWQIYRKIEICSIYVSLLILAVKIG